MSDTRAVGLLGVTPLIGPVIFTAITQAISYPFRSVRCTALYNDVLFAVIRCVLDRITIAQSRFLVPCTSAQYASYCKQYSIEPRTELYETVDGNKIAGYWLGSSDAQTVILYLHGGGYTQPASAGNFLHGGQLMEDLKSTKGIRSIATLFLDYTLAPEAAHPTQLREASAVLAHLLTHRKPSDIFLSGDSAGGNLALSVLSHVLHPHPEVAVVKVDAPLGGALLYSPWVGFSTDYPSYDNVKLDVVSPLSLRKWSAMFLGKPNPSNPEMDPGHVTGDAYTEVCKNPASWWKGMPSVCSEIFICYGGDEVFADSIEEFETALKDGWSSGGGDLSRVVFIRAPREPHIGPIIDIMAPGKKAKSSTQLAIDEWYRARLSN